MRARTLRRLLNLWPPFLFSGIRVRALADDWSEARVTLKLRPWNRNYVGTHFGGNLFAMTDPFWMLLVMHRLGSDYIVWDRAGAIEFVTPGRSHVHAHFRLDSDTVDALRREAADGHKVLRWFEVEVTDKEGETVARVRKQLYVRRKRRARPDTPDLG
jgi:acyl-coenzyme A thioesterase PaaI-like protein